MSSMGSTLALDFDGVIHNVDTHELLPGAAAGVQALHRAGWNIVIFTANRPAYVERWLRQKGLRRYVTKVTNEKPYAAVYVDDRAVRFTSWDALDVGKPR